MNNQDVARTFFARMDSHDSSGALALVAPQAEITLVPLKSPRGCRASWAPVFRTTFECVS